MSTSAEKLATIEHLVEDFRWARNDPTKPEHLTYQSLKEIAADLRARLGEAPIVSEIEIERRVTRVLRARSQHEDVAPALHALGNEIVSRWPVVRQALNRFGALEEAER